MTTLRKILSLSPTYTTENEHVELVKQLADLGYLKKSNAQSIITVNDKKDSAAIRNIDKAKKVLEFWPKGLDDEFSQVLDEKSANALLDKIIFTNEDAGWPWISSLADISGLRKDFHREGTAADRDNKSDINTDRFNFSGELDITQIEQNPNSNEYRILQSFKKLKLIDEVKVPENQEFDDIIIQGTLQKVVEDRIDFAVNYLSGLKEIKKPVRLVLVNGTRGAFNSTLDTKDEASLKDREAATAEILASSKFLNVPDKVDIIRKVLHDSKDNWTTNLNAVKEALLKAVGKTEWPEKVDSWYNEAPEVYERAAKAENRQSLKGWPVAMDIDVHLIEKHAKQNPKFAELLKTGKVVLYSVPTEPFKPGMFANVTDNMNAYAKKLGVGNRALYLSSNTAHETLRQGREATVALKAKSPTVEVTVAGPSAKKLRLQNAKTQLAQILFNDSVQVSKILLLKKSVAPTVSLINAAIAAGGKPSAVGFMSTSLNSSTKGIAIEDVYVAPKAKLQK